LVKKKIVMLEDALMKSKDAAKLQKLLQSQGEPAMFQDTVGNLITNRSE
jgi:hypothetical protein